MKAVNQYVEKNKIFIKGIVSFLLYFLLNFIGAIVINFTNFFPNITPTKTLIVLIVMNLILVFMLYFLNVKTIKKYILDKISFSGTLKNALIMFGLYFLALIIISILITALPEFTETNNQQQLNELYFKGNKFLFIILVVVFAPIIEELVFRYSLINIIDNFKFLSKIKILPYILSAFIFSLMHETAIFSEISPITIVHFMMYFIPSLVICLGYMLTNKNIFATILLHFLINALSVIAIYKS